jgi:hypothetical protein
MPGNVLAWRESRHEKCDIFRREAFIMAKFEQEIRTEKTPQVLNDFLTGFLSSRGFEKRGKPELNEWRKGLYWIRFLRFTYSPGALIVKAWINIPYPGMGSFVKYFAGKAELKTILQDLESSVATAASAPASLVATADAPATTPQEAPSTDMASLGFKRVSVIVMLLLRVITFGVYYSLWLLLRADSFNRLNSKTKLKPGVFVFILIVEALSVIFVIIGASVGSSVLGFAQLCIIVGFIVIEVQCFKMRRILSEHFGARLSGAGTFFFTIYYLQFKINRFFPQGTGDAVAL